MFGIPTWLAILGVVLGLWALVEAIEGLAKGYKRAEHYVRERHPSLLKFLPVLAVILALGLIVVAVVSQRQTDDASKPPEDAGPRFLVRMHSVFPFDSAWQEMWWTDGQRVRRRAHVAVYLQVTSLRPKPVTVESWGLEIRDGGDWYPLDPLPGEMFWVGTEKKASRGTFPSLLGELTRHRFEEGSAVIGWLFLRYRGPNGPLVLKEPEFRMFLRDATGRTETINAVPTASWAGPGHRIGTGDGGPFRLHGITEDISSIPKQPGDIDPAYRPSVAPPDGARPTDRPSPSAGRASRVH